MSVKIRVLHVEDNPDHALLIRRSLEKEDPDLEIVSVATAEEALRLYREDDFEVILSDYLLGPGMNGLELLRAIREQDAEIPFIILTGQGNEEVASQALREGADDYIIKRSGILQFKRVALTIRRQWESYRARRAREEAEIRYRHLVENVNAGIALVRGDRLTYVNPKLCEMTGYTAEELTSKPFSEFITPASREMVLERYFLRQRGEKPPATYDLWAYAKDGREICLELTASIMKDAEGSYTLAVLRDVTEQKLVAKRAEEAEEKLNLVFEGASDAIFIHDLEGRIIRANPAASRLTGYSPEELLSMRVQDLHVADERSLSETQLEKVRLRRFYGFLGTGRCKDGTTKKCAITGTVISGGDRPLFLSLVKEVADETEEDYEERVAAEAGERLKAAIDQAPLVAVQGYDQEGRVTYWNRASEELYGFRREEVMGKTLEELILSPEDTRVFREEIRRLWQGGEPSEPREWIVHDRQGRKRWVFSTIFPIRQEGKCREVFCMDLDITARKELEMELQERNRDLEALAHIVSHDLRSSLTSIEGFATLARDAGRGKLDDQAMEYFDYILNACRVMAATIKSVFEMARSGLKPGTRVEVDLTEMAREVWDELRIVDRAPRACLELPEAPATVVADPDLLKLVLSNLLDNAVKFNLENRSPLVALRLERGDEETVVAVEDNGPGIPEEYREIIYQPFRRLNDSTHGMGIGLSTVKRIVNNWRGRLWLESNPGKGSTFYFTIPD